MKDGFNKTSGPLKKCDLEISYWKSRNLRLFLPLPLSLNASLMAVGIKT